MGRGHGRITRDDIKAAGLRRWNGRGRVTTDWVNLYHEPELCADTGNCLVYLREPGQSGRGPSFRVHTSQLLRNGFRALVDRSTPQIRMHNCPSCISSQCQNCRQSSRLRALYLPAPRESNLDQTIDHHLGVRNFFAWLYNLPLAGRALGKSLVDLKELLDFHRPGHEAQNQLDLVAFAENQRYLDFRECVDHALAALHFAEAYQIEDLWIDAFAHSVGLSQHGLTHSVEYAQISRVTQAMITKARLEVDLRLDRVNRSVINFFENDLSNALLGLHQAAREHFDRFRSFLHSFYIEQHGFWPPQDLDDAEVKKAFYLTLYSDFRNLYSHLVNPASSTAIADIISASGGVCTLQNIQAFDARHRYEALPHRLPMIPNVSTVDAAVATKKRASFNPITRRKAEREARDEAAIQALIDSTNRDGSIMNCLLVRRYSEYERASVFDDYDRVSLVDGRKVRWILVYAVLQTLISVMQAPQQVRNTEGLSYPLCCHIPKVLPWQIGSLATSVASSRSSVKDKAELTPDVNYSHTNSSSSSLAHAMSKKERRMSLPFSASASASASIRSSKSSVGRSNSIRRMLTKRTNGATTDSTRTARPAFCEIFVPGYGNGLNEAKVESNLTIATHLASPSPASSPTERPSTPPSPTTTVSRESSSASASSAYSNRSSATETSNEDVSAMAHLDINDTKGDLRVRDEHNDMKEVHFNTATWDRFLDV